MIGGDRMLEPMHVGDKVAGLSYLLPLLIPHQPPPIERVSLQLWWLPIEDKYRFDLVEQKFAHPVVESNLESKTDEPRKRARGNTR